MTKRTIDADAILNRAKPLVHQQAHWQVAGPVAMAQDVAETTLIPRPPKGRDRIERIR